MRKLLLLILLFASLAEAQSQRTQSNPLGGNLTVQDAGTCSTNNSFLWQVLPVNAGTTTVNLAGTFTATVTFRESNNGGGTWTSAGTSSAAGTTTFSTNGFTDFCVDITAFTSGSVAVSISTGLQQVQSIVSGGGGLSQVAALPALPCINNSIVQLTVAPQQVYICVNGLWQAQSAMGYINPQAYGVALDVQFAFNGSFSFSNGGSTITCASCNFTAADVGKIIEATTWTGQTADTATSVLSFPVANITSVNAGVAQTSGTSTQASTGTGVLMWGHDDTTAWGNVYIAAALGNLCGVVQANGYSFVGAALFNTTPTCKPTGYSAAATHYVGFRGGETSNLVFIPHSGFTKASCPGTGNSYFFGFQGVSLENVAILGYGTNVGGSAACSIITSQIDGTYQNVVVGGWLNNTANSVGFTYGSAINAGAHLITNVTVTPAGALSCLVTGNARNAIGNFCETDTSAVAMQINSGAVFECYSCDYQVDSTSTATRAVDNSGIEVENNCQVSASPSVQSQLWSIPTNATNGGLGVQLSLTGCYNLTDSANANSDIVTVGTGATSAVVRLTNNFRMVGGSSGGIVCIQDNLPITIFTGNTYTPRPYSSLCNQVTVASSAGTSAATIDALSTNENGGFTLTGNATSATTTVTITFAGSFSLSGTAPTCNLTLKNGTGTWDARSSSREGTTNATSYAWLLDNNAVNLANGSTYRATWNCVPR